MPGDRRDQDAAQWARELHARRQFHPGRSSRTAQLFRLRRIQFGGHCQQRRSRTPDGGMDCGGRAQHRSLGRGRSPLWRVHRQPQGAGCAHRRNPGPALRDALAAPGAGDSPAPADIAPVRSSGRAGRRVWQPQRLGAGQLLPAARPGHAGPHARSSGLAALDDRRTEGHAGSRGALRSNVIFQVAAAGPRRIGGAATPVRQRHGRAGRQDGLHRAAQRAGRL
ncbi:MAG: hypothetical protein BWX79_02019 [Alphaproteobacteria bacterium ADurb.Bin100]|nr:MAG: hypothetical protein BWX79_02019 [Alphaproteobacteria bacterium ADurb.Bin100]